MNINNAKYYETEISAIKRELKTLPEGYLVARGSQYYVKAGDVQKGVTKDLQMVRQLARKAYLLRRLKHLEGNFSLNKILLRRYKTENHQEIIRGLPSFYRVLPVSYFYHPSIQAQIDKATDRPEGKAGYLNELFYLTGSGIRVRSKSERTIADALDQNGILYSYEAAQALGLEIRYPDFTVYRPSDGKKFLWEHFGLMDDGGYRRKSIEKVAFYGWAGFFPFDNLICTYEHDMQNLADIQALIDSYLLK